MFAATSRRPERQRRCFVQIKKLFPSLSCDRKSGPDSLGNIFRQQTRSREQFFRTGGRGYRSQKLQHPKGKYISVKFLSVTAQKNLTPEHRLELLNCRAKCAAVGLVKKETGLPVLDGFDGAAAPISNHRPSGGICFQGGHAEILFTGKYQRA